MATVAVPIIRLRYSDEDAFDLNLVDILEEAEANGSDEFTHTFWVVVEDPSQRERLRARMRERLPEEQAERVLALLDGNEWDVSFFVDCY